MSKVPKHISERQFIADENRKDRRVALAVVVVPAAIEALCKLLQPLLDAVQGL